MTKYLFFKGCTIPVKLPNIEKLAKEVLPSIGIELEEVEEFSCCPDPIQAQGANLTFWMATAARNLAIAEEKGMDILTLCNGCLQTLAVVNHELHHDGEMKEKINEMLKKIGKQYKGTVKVKHLMQVIKEDIGIDKLKTMVTKPLKGLVVAGHPGCHLLNPEEILKFDDPIEPVEYDKFINALGATAVDYVSKIECCGVSLSLAGEKDATNKAVRKKILDAKSVGAQVLSTACPFCFTQFDMGQVIASRAFPELKEKKLPVLYAVELLALAMGKSLEEIDFKSHKVAEAIPL